MVSSSFNRLYHNSGSHPRLHIRITWGSFKNPGSWASSPRNSGFIGMGWGHSISNVFKLSK